MTSSPLTPTSLAIGKPLRSKAADPINTHTSQSGTLQVNPGVTPPDTVTVDPLCARKKLAEVLSNAAAVKRPGAVVSRKLRTSDRKSTRLNSSHHSISYAVFC